MVESFPELKERILRRRPICEVCFIRRATQLHHCLVHDMKRYHKLLTVEENLMPTCDICHTSIEQSANQLKIRIEFAYRQINEYGLDVAEWYKALPLKFKEQWILNLQEVL